MKLKDVDNAFPIDIKRLNLYRQYPEILIKMIGYDYNTSEKFMMMGKAAMFGDDNILMICDKENIVNLAIEKADELLEKLRK